MKTALDTVVAKWLDDSVANETVSTQFKEGMERLVKNTAEDSGVWQVVVCASAAHAKRIYLANQRAGAAPGGARGAQKQDGEGSPARRRESCLVRRPRRRKRGLFLGGL